MKLPKVLPLFPKSAATFPQKYRHFQAGATLCALLALCLLLQSPGLAARNPGAPAPAERDSLTEHTRLQAFPTGTVQLLDGPFLQRQQLDAQFLLSLDPDRLLYFFLKNAGLKNPPRVKPYGGWEQTDLKGHTLGHYLSAMSRLYALTGSEECKEKLDHTIMVLDQCQQELGGGYIGASPETMLDVVETTGQGWAPYYTQHKILQGLIDAYRIGRSYQALALATNMGDYFCGRAERIKSDPANWQKVMDEMEQGGFSDALLQLYLLTRQPRYLECARLFQQTDKLLPASQGRDVLNDPAKPHNYRHANATIPQFTAAARMYEMTGDKFFRKAAVNFWETVTQRRTYANGSTGYAEHWNYGPDTLAKELGIKAGETCCSYNMILLSERLCCINPESKYADYVERALFNHILGSIHPENSNFMYFHTLEPGGFKTFGRNKDVFWCCTGTGMENPVRYTESIYLHSDDEIYVNQFIASRLTWREEGILLEQTTRFPEEGSSTLRFEGREKRFTLAIRVPYWCKTTMQISLNGEPQKVRPGRDGYCRIKRTWKPGDEVQLILPMELHAEPLPDAPQTAAILCGPIVLAGDLGTKGVTDKLINATDYFYGDVPKAYQVQMNIPEITGNAADLSWLQPEAGKPLHFTTRATSDGSTLRFVPLYGIYRNRFSVYWHLAPVPVPEE